MSSYQALYSSSRPSTGLVYTIRVYSWLIREPPAQLAAGDHSRITAVIATCYPAPAQDRRTAFASLRHTGVAPQRRGDQGIGQVAPGAAGMRPAHHCLLPPFPFEGLEAFISHTAWIAPTATLVSDVCMEDEASAW